MTTPIVAVVRTEDADPAVLLPAYQTAGSAGADIRANFPNGERASGVTLAAGARALLPTGIKVAVPPGYELQVRPRSGLALKQGLGIPNSPGTIDSDYRGPVGVLLVNHGSEPVHIAHGDRIAQLVLAPVLQAAFAQLDSLDDTERGAGGFGSTGQT